MQLNYYPQTLADSGNRRGYRKSIGLLCATLLTTLLLNGSAYAQYATKWMDIGSFQTWYSNAGSEYEEQRILAQQDGCRWPAIYPNQDMEAAKGIWIGVKNWKDASGHVWPVKVIHFGPRYDGDASEFVPITFTTTDRLTRPQVVVDGNTSVNIPPDIDQSGVAMNPDRIIYDSVNTSIGLTMTRKMIGFAQQYHDNYVIYDYTFYNTGNTNADPAIELPSNQLDSIRIFFQYRYAVCADTRYVIGRNSAGWGVGANSDTRGDGLAPSSTFFGSIVRKTRPVNGDDDVRAQYTWMGNFNNPSYGSFSFPGMPGLGVPGAPPSDNIGGPIWGRADASGVGPAADDTMGRLGSAQFIGVATIHADKPNAGTSGVTSVDDFSQPSTTAYVSSDDPLNSQNSQFNDVKMQSEYELMASGHGVGWLAGKAVWTGQRLADLVGLGGDPTQGTTGGFSVANGYGSYNLGIGQSFHIVMVEAAAGLSREACISVGHQFKWGAITPAQKDDSVYTGRDSLFQTFRRAIANYNSGYSIPQGPPPPTSFTVTSGGDRISLAWDAPSDPRIQGFKIYRAVSRVDSAYHLVFQGGPSDRSYSDATAIRGFAYYYYIVSVGSPADNNGAGNTPLGALESNRYFTQTYDPASLLRPGVPAPVKVVSSPSTAYSTAKSKSYNVALTAAAQNATAPPPPHAVYTNNGAIFTVQSNSSTVGTANVTVDTTIAGTDTTYTAHATATYSGTITFNGTGNASNTAAFVRSSTTGGPDSIAFTSGQTSGISQKDIIRVVPNPYNISAQLNRLRYPGEPNKIGFLNIPPVCTIKIYTELGELIQTIQHTNGSGDAYWNLNTSSDQIVVSGIYIAVFQPPSGQTTIKKFVVIR